MNGSKNPRLYCFPCMVDVALYIGTQRCNTNRHTCNPCYSVIHYLKFQSFHPPIFNFINIQSLPCWELFPILSQTFTSNCTRHLPVHQVLVVIIINHSKAMHDNLVLVIPHPMAGWLARRQVNLGRKKVRVVKASPPSPSPSWHPDPFFPPNSCLCLSLYLLNSVSHFPTMLLVGPALLSSPTPNRSSILSATPSVQAEFRCSLYYQTSGEKWQPGICSVFFPPYFCYK